MKSIFIGMLALSSSLSYGVTESHFTEKINIGLIDSAFDLEHEDISPFVDKSLLNQILIDKDNSLLQVNSKRLKEYQQQITKKMDMNEAADIGSYFLSIGKFKNECSKLTNPDELAKLHELEEMKRPSTLNLLLAGKIKIITASQTMNHGSNVAGTMLKDLDSKAVNLIPIPMQFKMAYQPSSDEKVTMKELRESKKENKFSAKEVSDYFEKLSQIIQANSIRVMNLSLGLHDDNIKQILKSEISTLNKVLYKKLILKLAGQEAEINVAEFKKFLQNNPKTIFVVAAGNEKKKLEDFLNHTSATKLPNVLIVASGTEHGLSDYSNSSIQGYISVVANGTCSIGPRVGGGKTIMSGTSQAAPKVSNALARILQDAPHLSVKDVINQFFSNNTVTTKFSYAIREQGRLQGFSDIEIPVLKQAN